MQPSIHERETRILRTACHRTCASCARRVPDDACYCGMCGHRRHEQLRRTGRVRLTGRILDDVYRIEELISESGFAAIYRAMYVPTGQAVAIKVLHPELATDPRIRARFRRERRCLARLRSVHTVRMLDAGETDDGLHYLVMELLCGASLYDRLAASGPLPWREALAILGAVCGALAEAHAFDIVHRDLKPANIYLDRGGVKLIDFGIATIHEDSQDGDLTRIGQAIGTLGYMAPEQLAGAPCDARSDIFSLGVVAYELLTGRRPFAHHESAEAVISALATEAPVPPSARSRREIPAAVDALVLRCLAPDPRRRFANVERLASEIDRVIARPLAARSALPAFTEDLVRGTLPAFVLSPAATDPEIAIDPRPHRARRFAWLLALVASSGASIAAGLLA